NTQGRSFGLSLLSHRSSEFNGGSTTVCGPAVSNLNPRRFVAPPEKNLSLIGKHRSLSPGAPPTPSILPSPLQSAIREVEARPMRAEKASVVLPSSGVNWSSVLYR